jgi:hypothetical protein
MVDAGRAVGLMMDAIAERSAAPAREVFEPVALRLVPEPQPELVHLPAMVQN